MIRRKLLSGDFRAAKHGEVQFFQRDAVPIRRSDQLPGVGDGFLFKIIAEGKIAEHFKKSVMAISEADVFEVVVFSSGAHAFLAGSGGFVVALFEAEENVLELVHPGVGEEQRGVVSGDERRTAHDAVAALFEKFQKCFADFVASPVSTSQRHPQWKGVIIADELRSRNAKRRWVNEPFDCLRASISAGLLL